MSATVVAEAWAGSLTQAAAWLAGDDPSVRQRWKSPLHPSSVQLGRHFQRSVVQSISENRTALKLQPLYILPGVSELLAGQVSCGCVLLHGLGEQWLWECSKACQGWPDPALSSSMAVHLRGHWAAAAAAGRE